MAVGLVCMTMAAMVFFAGVVGLIVLLCTRGGRRALTTLALLMLAFCALVGFLRFRSVYQQAQEAASLEQEAVADRVRAEIEARLGGDALEESTEPSPDNVTLELRWHADKLHEVTASPAAIADAVSSILTAVDDPTNDKADLAGVPLKNLLELQVLIDDEHKVPLGEVAKVRRRRVVGVERPEDTIHIRLEGVEPGQIEALLAQASSLIEQAVTSADDPLRSLVNIDRDEDAHGFSIRIPAREVRQVAAGLILPAGLDTRPMKVVLATEAKVEVKPTEVQPVAAEEPLKPAATTPEVPALPQVPAAPPVPQVAQVETASAVSKEPQGEKPDWVDQGERRLPNGIYRLTASSGPFSSTEECFAEAPSMVQGMVMRYVGRLFGREAQDQFKVPGGWIESALVKDQWIGEVESETLGTTMYEMHVLVEFDDAARRELAGMWQREQLDRRLAMTGAASGLVLLLLGTTFGYLKLDTATRGFYSGRLKLAAGVIVASVAGLLIMQMRML